MEFKTLTVALSALSAVAFSAHAQTEPAYCANDQSVRDSPFTKVEYGLAYTSQRAACGVDISPDIAFWTSMWRYYGCSDDSGVAEAMRHFWEDLLPKTLQQARQLEEDDPAKLKEICAGTDALQFPKKFHPGLKSEDWRRKKPGLEQ